MDVINSNFDFIKEYEPKIYSKGKEAEQLYCEKHFESSANFSRQILELILKLYLSSIPELERFHSTTLRTCIDNLEYIGCCGKKLISTMHEIRVLGNKASHPNSKFDKNKAYLCLSKIFDVCVWYLNKKGIPSDHNLIFRDPLTEKKDTCKPVTTLHLKQCFSKYDLTNDQNSLVEKLENFLSYENNDNAFILRGYAGTGKTFIVKGIVEYLRNIKRDYLLMAPTGKASMVLEQKTEAQARTIHSGIYCLSRFCDYPIDQQDNSSVYKMYFSIAYNDIGADCIYIVDESSMISNIRSEQETVVFGTGKLLDDLLKFINFDHNDHHKKVIFIGDSAQLPPIEYNKKIGSPALNKEYLSKTYNLKTDEFELTDVVRQKENSAILETSIGLRNSIKSKCYSTINFTFKPGEVERIDVNSFINKYTEFLDKNKATNDTIVIARTNKEVQDYNNVIRTIIFSNTLTTNNDELPSLQVNERLICVKNTNQFKNGEFFDLCSLQGEVETFIITLKVRANNNKVKEEKIKLSFQDAVIKTERGVIQETKLLLNLLNSNLAGLTPIEQQALYIFFKMRNKGLSPKDPRFKKAFLEDPYLNAVQVKFGYALTGHKAQGSEWKNVFIDTYSPNKQNEDYFRWLYTSVTRAKQHLIGIGMCNMNVITNAKII